MIKTKKLFLYGGVFLLFLLDLFAKYYFRTHSTISIPIIGDLVSLRLFINSTLAFSIPYTWSTFLTFCTAIILGALLIWWYIDFRHSKKLLFPLYLIILGAFSNLLDRIWFNSVTDYIHLAPVSYFNIADLLIFAGVLLIIFPRRFHL